MPIIDPPETIYARRKDIAMVAATVRGHQKSGEVFRRDVTDATERLLIALVRAPRIFNGHSIEAAAEDVWWVTRAADDLANDRNFPPVGDLFTAVDELTLGLQLQAPRTDRGLVALVEAEMTISDALGDHSRE